MLGLEIVLGLGLELGLGLGSMNFYSYHKCKELC
jgi:hypothetical protein